MQKSHAERTIVIPPQIRAIADVENFEETPWRELCPLARTFEVIPRDARQNGGRAAIEFLARVLPDEEPSRSG